MRKSKTLSRHKTLGWVSFALMVVLGLAVYHMKYKVMELEEKLDNTLANIAHEEETLQVLKAEWEYLTNPQRLSQINKDQKTLSPLQPFQITTLESLENLQVANRQQNEAPTASSKPWIRTSTTWE